MPRCRQGRTIPLIGCIFALVFWGLFALDVLLPWKNALPCIPSWLFKDLSDEAEHEQEDTDGVAYADVPKIKNYEIERYVCPAVTHKQRPEELERAAFELTEAKLVVQRWDKVVSRSGEAREATRRKKADEAAKLALHV